MHNSNRDIVVVGAGIAGLAVARALALTGAKVIVLEQAPVVTEVGAGIQISPNGTAVLRALGLEDAVRGTGAPVARALNLRNAEGQGLARFPFAGLKRPADYLCLHRADLIDVLAQGARDAGVEIRLDSHVAEIELGARPTVHLTKDASLNCGLVIGADGLHSNVAKSVVRREEPFFTGQVAWRSVVTGDDRPFEVELYMAPGRHVVTYPLSDGRLRNIVAVEERSDWVHESWSRKDSPEAVRKSFASMGKRPRALIDRIESVNVWGLFRHPVARKWHAGNVVLLGDAVHPTLPFLAQGACMALEDAWVLTKALDRNADNRAAFQAYQSARLQRVEKIVNAATGNARKFHLGGPLAFGMQLGLRVAGTVLPSAISRNFAWLYDHDVTGGERLGHRSRSTHTGT